MADYEYTCPHCGKTISTTSTGGAPLLGDIHKCSQCGKLGKIRFANMVYEVEKADDNAEPTPARPACECYLEDEEEGG